MLKIRTKEEAELCIICLIWRLPPEAASIACSKFEGRARLSILSSVDRLVRSFVEEERAVAMEEEEDDVAVALEKVVSEWEAAFAQANGKIRDVAACGSKGGIADAASLPRLNASAQDSLALLRSLQLQLEVLAPQHPNEEESERHQQKLKQWKESHEELRLSLRNANLQGKRNIDTHAKEEREALLAGGMDATMRRRNLQTQAGMTAATESVTESLRRTRQMMAQEAERGISTLSTLDQSNLTLRKAESEYTGQRTLLRITRNLLSSMQRHDVLDRVVLVVGAIFFLLVCAYILRKRIVPFKQRVRVPVLESIQVKSPVASPHSAAPSYSSAVNDEL